MLVKKNKQNFKRRKFVGTKKKFIIALISVSIIAVTLLASLIAVVASFNAKTTAGGFKVSYTAKNVRATIAAEYKIGSGQYNTIQTTDNADLITFDGSETAETTEKSFKSLDSITLGQGESMYIHYTITNIDDSATPTTFRVVSTSTITTSTNLTIEYATSEGATTWEDSLSDIADVASVTYGTPLNLYVKISITTATQDATFEGSFNFELISNN
jgi:hypothetical protein